MSFIIYQDEVIPLLKSGKTQVRQQRFSAQCQSKNTPTGMRDQEYRILGIISVTVK
jgi:hypothetical protein